MADNMKVSIITVVLNNRDTIEDCMLSVFNQSYPDIEYIIIDGGSVDGTVDIIKKYESKIAKWVSEPDGGIYDAMNKGIKLASGDIIGILNSDDVYINDDVISEVVREFKNKDVDSIYGDLVYVRRDDLNKVVRYYNSGRFNRQRLSWGFMPAHPTLFVKRRIYDEFGLFKQEYKISGDFELIARIFGKGSISCSYINKPIIKMRTGGVSSSLRNKIKLNKEIYKACKENGIRTNYVLLALRSIYKLSEPFPSKRLRKIKESE